jgi:uncharacterized protein YgfB (UPF0149 family)
MLADRTEEMMGYAALADLLADAGAPGEASEYHGTLCGLCCGMPEAGPEGWSARALAAADADEHVARDVRSAFTKLGADLRADLAGGELAFAPVLPDDDAPLAERARALARWCEGYLYGLALVDADAVRALAGDAREALADFAQIACAAGVANATESDEAAYAELVEFVRVGVQLVFEELRQRRGEN